MIPEETTNGVTAEAPHSVVTDVSRESFRYDFEIDPDADSTHAKIVRLVGERKRVLELGCATGYMSRVLRDRGCVVAAVEIDPAAAERAAPYCERVVVGDLDLLDLQSEFRGEQFDVVVAADVLEHLKDPVRVLRSAKSLLRPDGRVVASLPNVAHGSVRLALLTGRFSYQNKGLLDDSHLHFYTADTVLDLFESAGYALGHLDRQELLIDRSEITFDEAEVPASVLDYLKTSPDATTYQFIIVAYPLPTENLAFLQARFRELVELASRQAIDLRVQQAERDELTRQIEVLTSEFSTVRTDSGESNGATRKGEGSNLEAGLGRLMEEHLQAMRSSVLDRDDLQRQLHAALTEANQVKSENASLNDELARTVRSFRETQALLDDYSVRIESLTDQRRALRDQLIEAHDQLFRRDAAIQESQRDLISKAGLEQRITALEEELRRKDAYIESKERHVADLQAALDRILYSAPGKVYRRARSIVTFGRR